MNNNFCEEQLEDVKRYIGWSIQSLRKRRGLTLEDVSKKTDISIPLLSQLERGDANINIANLWKISRALDVEVEFFFQQKALQKEIQIIRKEERRKYTPDHAILEFTGYSFEHLYSIPDVEVFVAEIDKLTRKQAKFNTHIGIECAFVLEGEVEFLLKDGYCTILRPGDAIRFPAEHPHAYRGVNGKSRVLAILYMLSARRDIEIDHKKLDFFQKNAKSNGIVKRQKHNVLVQDQSN